MAELSGLQVFKYLPAAKKLPEGNCKKCGFPTCMAYALKLAKGESDINLCPHAPDELKEIFTQSMKKPQQEIMLGHESQVLVGGENVLYRHDKTFINKTAIAVVIDLEKDDGEQKLNRVLDFEITRVNELMRVDLVLLKDAKTQRCIDAKQSAIKKLNAANMPWIVEEDLNQLMEVKEKTPFETIQELTFIRKKAVLEKDEDYSKPVYVFFKSQLGAADSNKQPNQLNDGGLVNPPYFDACPTSPLAGEVCFQCKQEANIREQGEGLLSSDSLLSLIARASFYLCKYANMLIFEDFDEALISTLMTLRQNIYTDPQKPLQVESKVYEFNNPNENSLIFLTTNFALTYFAVANEIEALNKPAYLVVTPSDGMSVLTAWSAEKFTAQIVARTAAKFELSKKVKNKQIIIPGLLAHMKEELQEALPEFEFLIGPNEAYMLGDFVKSLS